MSLPHQPSGLQYGLSFLIDAQWTPEQALAVFELLDDLRERIWLQYQSQIQALLQEQQTKPGNGKVPITDAPPF
jgi:hypothetical protein